MNNPGMNIKHPKLRGEWAELRFMAAAAEHGLHVTKPWGDTLQYDFVVESGAQFEPVQVKSTGFKTHAGYSCAMRRCRGPYGDDPFDYLVVYLVPIDIWYIIPEQVVHGQQSFLLYPQIEDSKVLALSGIVGTADRETCGSNPVTLTFACFFLPHERITTRGCNSFVRCARNHSGAFCPPLVSKYAPKYAPNPSKEEQRTCVVKFGFWPLRAGR